MQNLKIALWQEPQPIGMPVAKDLHLEENQKGLSYEKLFGPYCNKHIGPQAQVIPEREAPE